MIINSIVYGDADPSEEVADPELEEDDDDVLFFFSSLPFLPSFCSCFFGLSFRLTEADEEGGAVADEEVTVAVLLDVDATAAAEGSGTVLPPDGGPLAALGRLVGALSHSWLSSQDWSMKSA